MTARRLVLVALVVLACVVCLADARKSHPSNKPVQHHSKYHRHNTHHHPYHHNHHNSHHHHHHQRHRIRSPVLRKALAARFRARMMKRMQARLNNQNHNVNNNNQPAVIPAATLTDVIDQQTAKQGFQQVSNVNNVVNPAVLEPDQAQQAQPASPNAISEFQFQEADGDVIRLPVQLVLVNSLHSDSLHSGLTAPEVREYMHTAQNTWDDLARIHLEETVIQPVNVDEDLAKVFESDTWLHSNINDKCHFIQQTLLGKVLDEDKLHFIFINHLRVSGKTITCRDNNSVIVAVKTYDARVIVHSLGHLLTLEENQGGETIMNPSRYRAVIDHDMRRQARSAAMRLRAYLEGKSAVNEVGQNEFPTAADGTINIPVQLLLARAPHSAHLHTNWTNAEAHALFVLPQQVWMGLAQINLYEQPQDARELDIDHSAAEQFEGDHWPISLRSEKCAFVKERLLHGNPDSFRISIIIVGSLRLREQALTCTANDEHFIVISQDARPTVLSHSIGHILSLNDLSESDSIMNSRSPVSNLSPFEINKARGYAVELAKEQFKIREMEPHVDAVEVLKHRALPQSSSPN